MSIIHWRRQLYVWITVSVYIDMYASSYCNGSNLRKTCLCQEDTGPTLSWKYSRKVNKLRSSGQKKGKCLPGKTGYKAGLYAWRPELLTGAEWGSTHFQAKISHPDLYLSNNFLHSQGNKRPVVHSSLHIYLCRGISLVSTNNRKKLVTMKNAKQGELNSMPRSTARCRWCNYTWWESVRQWLCTYVHTTPIKTGARQPTRWRGTSTVEWRTRVLGWTLGCELGTRATSSSRKNQQLQWEDGWADPWGVHLQT